VFTARYGLNPYTKFTLSYRKTACVYCAVRAKSSNTIHINPSPFIRHHGAQIMEGLKQQRRQMSLSRWRDTWLSSRHEKLRRMVSRTGTTRSVFAAAQWRLVASSWGARSHDLRNSSTATTPQTRVRDLHSYRHQSALTCTTANFKDVPTNCMHRISSGKLNSRPAVQEIPSLSLKGAG
jgi:hypothetical protein